MSIYFPTPFFFREKPIRFRVPDLQRRQGCLFAFQDEQFIEIYPSSSDLSGSLTEAELRDLPRFYAHILQSKEVQDEIWRLQKEETNRLLHNSSARHQRPTKKE